MLENYKFNKLSKYKHTILKLKENTIKKSSNPAIFFDRDGVLIKDVHYISNSDDVDLLPGVRELLSKLCKYGWMIIVVTNQSGISRGFSTWEDYEKITIKMLKMIGGEPLIDGIYANSFLPSESFSKEHWRKPSPGMIFEAAKQFNINLTNSIFIGDRLTDLISARDAGINQFIHVLTGHGKNEHESIMEFFKKSNYKNKLLTLKSLAEFKNDNLLKSIIK